MDFNFLFSVVDFKMFKDDDPGEYWFDLKSTKKIKTEIKIVPLFNTMINQHHDKWDDFILAEIKIIVNLMKTSNVGKKIIKEELISYESTLFEFDSERHVYKIKVDFDILEILDEIKIDSFYTINLSYIIENAITTEDNILKVIDSNTFFSTTVPFSKDGGWIHGS